jgi:hypothetical protein
VIDPDAAWTAYDAKHFGVQCREVPMVAQQRAYTSPTGHAEELRSRLR